MSQTHTETHLADTHPAETHAQASTPEAAAMAAPQAVSQLQDAELDAALQKAGIQARDPQARAHLRGSLEKANRLNQLALDDPKYIEHAAHMGLDPNITLQGLAQVQAEREKLKQGVEAYQQEILEKSEKIVRGKSWGSIAGVLVGVGSTIAAVAIKWKDQIKNTETRLKTGSIALLVATVAGTALGWIGSKLAGGDPEKLKTEVQAKGQEFGSRFTQLDQAEAQLLSAEADQFTGVHLQRALKGYEEKQHAAALKHVAPAAHKPTHSEVHASPSDPLPATPPVEPARPAQGVAPEAHTAHAPQTVSTDGEPLGAKAHTGRGSGESVTHEIGHQAGNATHPVAPYDTYPASKSPPVDGGTKPPFGTTASEIASAPGDEQRVPSYAEAAPKEVVGAYTAKAVSENSSRGIADEKQRWA